MKTKIRPDIHERFLKILARADAAERAKVARPLGWTEDLSGGHRAPYPDQDTQFERPAQETS